MAIDQKWSLSQRSIIGSMLIEPGCIPSTVPELRTEDFSGALREIFGAICQLNLERVPIDAVTVLHRLGDSAELKQLMFELIRETPTARNVREYVTICKGEARLSLLQQSGMQLVSASTLEEAREALNAAAAISMDTGDERKSVSAAQAVTTFYTKLTSGEKKEFIRTGIDCIDNTIRTERGNFHVIAGRPGHGKSALALQMAYGMAEGLNVGFFALETSEEEWTARLIAHVAAVDYGAVQTMEPDDKQYAAIAKACGQISARKLSFEPASGMTVDDIRARCLQKRYDVIFVDYLQLVSVPNANRFGRYQAVTDISLGLRDLATRYHVVVIALSQLRRDQATGEFAPVPELSDLRESGQIEQDANAVIMVHAPLRKQHPEFRVLDVAKNRNGQLRSFYADFAGELQTFREPIPAQFALFKTLMDTKGGGIKGSGNAAQQKFLEREGEKRREREKENA